MRTQDHDPARADLLLEMSRLETSHHDWRRACDARERAQTAAEREALDLAEAAALDPLTDAAWALLSRVRHLSAALNTLLPCALAALDALTDASARAELTAERLATHGEGARVAALGRDRAQRLDAARDLISSAAASLDEALAALDAS